MMEKYGATFNFYLMWENIISTYEPQNIKVGLNPRMGRRIYDPFKTILATDFPNYEKGKCRLGTDSIFSGFH
jgi:hypothetical protein